MTDLNPTTSPQSPALLGLTPEAAHARHVLDVAGRGPESTRGLVVDVMMTLVERGYRNSVTWYLAPSPTDDLHQVIFSVRSSATDDPERRRWHDRREIAAVLAEARQLADGDPVEVWSGNSHGLRRLVLVGGGGRPLRFLTPEAPQFAGNGPEAVAAATAAVHAWRSWNAEAGSAPPTPSEAPPAPQAVVSLRLPEDPTVPVPVLSLGPGTTTEPPETAISPVVTAALDPDALATALQEALAQVRVEVDLGAVEDLVSDSLRAALAELPSTFPVVSPEAPSIGRGPAPGAEVGPVDPDRGNEDQPVALSAPLERALQITVAAVVEATLSAQLPGLMRQLGPSDTTTTDHPTPPALGPSTIAGPGPAGQSPELDELVRRSIAGFDASLYRILPRLTEQLAAATAEQVAASPSPPDPVDVARRLAASVLSPGEIAETIVFRLRPFLGEQSERVLRRQEAESDRERLALDRMRQGIEQLNERMDRRLQRLEEEVRGSQAAGRGSHSKSPSAERKDAARSAPTPDDDADQPSSTAGLRMLRPDHGG